jgi:hypothetical protein
MTPTDLAPPHVAIVAACAGCSRSRQAAVVLLATIERLQGQLDAERLHSAELEARAHRSRGPWEVES